MGELARKSWYMAATDSQTLLKELKKQSTIIQFSAGSSEVDGAASPDPREAGVDMWRYLMERIGKGEEARRDGNETSFDDMMLYEFARERLLAYQKDNNNEEEELNIDANSNSSISTTFLEGTVDSVVKQALAAHKILEGMKGGDGKNAATEDAFELIRDVALDVKVGSMFCASASKHSPFLLNNQEFHKSLLLLIQDDENISIAVILNLPSMQSVSFPSKSPNEVGEGSGQIPQRFGGKFGIRGATEKPFVWLHCNDALRDAEVGEPLRRRNGIWSCSPDDVEVALRMGIAKPQDFLCVSGFTVFPAGIQSEILSGHFRKVPDEIQGAVWEILTRQTILTPETVDSNLLLAKQAWSMAVGDNKEESTNGKKLDSANDYVFNTHLTVQELADLALRKKITYLLL